MAKTVESPKQAIFDRDDKRAQYARLIVFNFGVKEKLIPKDKDVNTVSESLLQKAWKSLVGGTLLQGKDGIEEIMKLSKNGSTTGNALTVAYAQEVRPFLRRGQLAPSFGRRARQVSEKPAAARKSTTGGRKKASTARKGGSKKATRGSSGRKGSRGTSKPKTEAAPVAEEGASVEA